MPPEAEAAFRDYLERRMRQPRFANGRSVRNALERARLRLRTRLPNARWPSPTPSGPPPRRSGGRRCRSRSA
ncbi:MAG: hypothetical protein ACRD0Q_08270 [Acidimicrobiales bacterium]